MDSIFKEDGKVTYFYEIHTDIKPFEVDADTDDAAIVKVQEQAGQYMIGVHTIYAKEVDNSNRIIWME
jgi:hypothetical protein